MQTEAIRLIRGFLFLKQTLIHVTGRNIHVTGGVWKDLFPARVVYNCLLIDYIHLSDDEFSGLHLEV